jgi:hypothetical protein
MKPKSTFKNRCMKLFIAISLLVLSAELLAQEQGAPDLKDFTIIIEKTENGIKMESPKGSAWMNVSFSMTCEKPYAIDEYGMTTLESVSPKKDPDIADYLFVITKTKDGIILKGIEGSAWKELRFSLSNNEKQTINQFGMTD